MQGLSISIRLREKTVEMYLTPENCNQQLAQLIVQQRLSLQQATQIKDIIVRDVRIMHREYSRQLQRSQQCKVGPISSQEYSPNVTQPKHDQQRGSVKQQDNQGSDLSEREEPTKYQHKHTPSYSHSGKYSEAKQQSKLGKTSHISPNQNEQRRVGYNPESLSSKKCVLLKDLKAKGVRITPDGRRHNNNHTQLFQKLHCHSNKSRKVLRTEQDTPSDLTLKARKPNIKHPPKSKSKSPNLQFRLETAQRADKSKTFCASRQILETSQARRRQQKQREKQIRKLLRNQQHQYKPNDKSCEAHKCEVWRDKMTPKVEESYSFHPKINHYPIPTPHKHGTITKKLLHADLAQFYSKFQREAARVIQS